DLASGEEISVEDLLEATLIPSANDAANALADHVGRRGGAKRFVRLMNRKAQRMGLTDTVFVRPDGLDVAGHVSSARDVLRLTAEAMRNPLFRSIVGTETATIAGGRKLETTNGLLATYRGTYGVKTGHTDSAGWSEAAAARRNGVSLYAVVLGGPSEARRDTDLRRLLNWGFSQFGRVTVISEGRTYARADIPFQSDRQLELIGDRSVSRVVQFGKPLVERVVAPASVRLPVVAGEPRGTVQIIAGDRVIAQRPLVAAESIGEPDVTSRIGWYARRTMSHASDLLNSVLGVIW
ncbi:MAG: D-alanyl-D-alanine carboxypeptidase family protein, partial [Gaiellales bacterium]